MSFRAFVLVAVSVFGSVGARADTLSVKTLRVNGYEMSFVEEGSGTPVLLIHGSGIDYRYFAAQMDPLSVRGFRTIAVSLRHFYPEHWNGQGEFSTRQHVSDVVAFIRKLHAGPVHLVGYSRGGTVALYVARKHPELLRTLTLAEGGAGIPAFAAPPGDGEPGRSDVDKTVLGKFSSGDVDGGIATFIDYSVGPGTWDRASAEVKGWLRDNAWTFVGIAKDRLDPFTCADATAIRVPTLLLGGDQSPRHQRIMVDKVQACMPHAERKVIAHSSHAMPRMNASGFNEAVLEFISRH